MIWMGWELIALRARPPKMHSWSPASQTWTSLMLKACYVLLSRRINFARRFFEYGISWNLTQKISNFHLSILKSVLARINGKQHPGRYPTKNIEHTIVEFPFVYANKHTILCSFRLTFMCVFCVNLLRKALFPPACTGSLAKRRAVREMSIYQKQQQRLTWMHILLLSTAASKSSTKETETRCAHADAVPFPSLSSIYAKLIFQYVSIICLVRDVSNCSRFARRNFLPSCANFPSLFLYFPLQISAASRNRLPHLRHMVSSLRRWSRKKMYSKPLF